MRNILLHNPIFIFMLTIFTIFINIVTSVHFLPIMLAGIIFLALKKCVKNSYYYSATTLIIGFLFIEYNNGFIPFSLTLLSFFIYIFVIPYLTRVISLHNLNSYIYIITFYLGMLILWSFTNGFSFYLLKNIFINILIDFIIFGLFL